MRNHVGHDHHLSHHFEIADFDHTANRILIRYQETPWLSDPERTVEMSFADFLAGLMDGRFEILRAKASGRI